MDFIPVVYSTPSASAIARFVLERYDLPGPVDCSLLNRGWNDIFEIRVKGGERFVLRLSKRRLRGDADVATETAFLAYLDHSGVPVAAAVPTRDGSLFTSALFPEGERPAVLFHYAEGRSSQGRGSIADARANGITLARIHALAAGFSAGGGRYRLDADHLLHKPSSAITAVVDLSDSVRTGFADLTRRLAARLSEQQGLSWTHCHGDCHGYNANIAVDGPRAGEAVFFDFDESGPGYLAYDLAVFLWACVLFGQDHRAFWHAFLDGYRTIRDVPSVDLEAAHLFVPIRHIWLVGEYASRLYEWGRQAVPAEWITAQLDVMLAWEKQQLERRLF